MTGPRNKSADIIIEQQSPRKKEVWVDGLVNNLWLDLNHRFILQIMIK